MKIILVIVALTSLGGAASLGIFRVFMGNYLISLWYPGVFFLISVACLAFILLTKREVGISVETRAGWVTLPVGLFHLPNMVKGLDGKYVQAGEVLSPDDVKKALLYAGFTEDK